MGCQSQPNHGLLIGAIVYLLDLMAEDARGAKRLGLRSDANELWKVGAYVCTLTAASLWGHEGFYLDLVGMRKHLHKGRVGTIPMGLDKSTVLTKEVCLSLPHVTIFLLGKLKGKTGVDTLLRSPMKRLLGSPHDGGWRNWLRCVKVKVGLMGRHSQSRMKSSPRPPTTTLSSESI